MPADPLRQRCLNLETRLLTPSILELLETLDPQQPVDATSTARKPAVDYRFDDVREEQVRAVVVRRAKRGAEHPVGHAEGTALFRPSSAHCERRKNTTALPYDPGEARDYGSAATSRCVIDG